jgi:capsular polysaccharide biosynthesis protein
MVVAATVRAGSPELAVDFAQALFDVASASELARTFPVFKLSAPQAPDAPESPKRRRNLLLGGAVGFLLATALAFLRADMERGGRQIAQIFRSAP